jgi:hypothetical protein
MRTVLPRSFLVFGPAGQSVAILASIPVAHGALHMLGDPLGERLHAVLFAIQFVAFVWPARLAVATDGFCLSRFGFARYVPFTASTKLTLERNRLYVRGETEWVVYAYVTPWRYAERLLETAREMLARWWRYEEPQVRSASLDVWAAHREGDAEAMRPSRVLENPRCPASLRVRAARALAREEGGTEQIARVHRASVDPRIRGELRRVLLGTARDE